MTHFFLEPTLSPIAAVLALSDRVELRLEDQWLAIAFLTALRAPLSDQPGAEAAGVQGDLVSQLVASEPFGRELAGRVEGGDRNASVALLHLLMDRDRLREVIVEADLQHLSMFFDCE